MLLLCSGGANLTPCLGSGSWRVSDCLPFSTGGATRTLSVGCTPPCVAGTRQPLCLGGTDSESDTATSPPLRTILGEGFSMLKTRSAEYRRDSGTACEIHFTGWAAAGGGPLYQQRFQSRGMAAILSPGTAPADRYVSPFLEVSVGGAAHGGHTHLRRDLAVVPPPPGGLPFEGTARRGKPRTLAAITAAAAAGTAAVASPPGSEKVAARRTALLDTADR